MAEEVRTARGARWLIWLFAALGVCAAVAVIFIAVVVFEFKNHRDAEPAPIEAKGAKERFAVAGVEDVSGTGLAQIVIAAEGSVGGGGSYSGRGPTDERNLLLLDKATGTSRKLLADNSRGIVARYRLSAVAGATPNDDDVYEIAADGKKQLAPVAYYLLRVRAPEGGLEDVLLGDLKTGRQDYVLKGIDGIDRIWMLTPTRLAMLMRQGRKLHYRAFEVPELKLVAARAIEID